MRTDLTKTYLTNVLGLKHLPARVLWPKSADEQTVSSTSGQSLFAVYLKSQPTVEEQELLTKMLSAIGQHSFEVTLSVDDFEGYKNILNFSLTTVPFSIQEDIGTKQWNFGSLSNYMVGTATEIGAHKKKAWEFLKKFKAEVL